MSITWLTDAGGLAEPVEVHGTAKEVWTQDKISCGVQLRCPWANRHAILDNMLTYAPPWPYHAVPVAYAVGGSIANDAGVNAADGSGLSYTDALLDVSFETLSKKDDGETGEITIYDESLEPTAEFLTLPPDGFKWHDASGTVLKKEEAPGRLEIGLDYVVTFSNLSSIPAAALTLIGKVNTDAVTSPSLGMTFGVETLLFNPPKISRKVTIGGDNKFTMTVRFTYKPAGWNKFWRSNKSGGAGYDDIYDTVAGAVYKNFQPASFVGVLP